MQTAVDLSRSEPKLVATPTTVANTAIQSIALPIYVYFIAQKRCQCAADQTGRVFSELKICDT